ncbi:hypothetical protein AB1Y20_018025 [Prymnesium parvum]|uniref:Uncharacterized protein n=1 Tax=Prymnesium parvum TaxID=97485 RepID=A0AB34JLX1_PRYPA
MGGSLPVVTAPLPRDHELEGGRVTDGPALDTRVRAAVEAARQIPVGFASYRNLRHASEGELWRETLPRLRELARGLQPSAAPGLLEHVQTLVQIYGAREFARQQEEDRQRIPERCRLLFVRRGRGHGGPSQTMDRSRD